MYCSNCGEKLKEKADFCTKCGTMIEKKTMKRKSENELNNGKSIASMILGICAVFFAFNSFDIGNSLVNLSEFRKIGIIMNQISLQIILAILGLIFGLMELKKNRNDYNVSGVILSLITFCLSTILFIFIISQ